MKRRNQQPTNRYRQYHQHFWALAIVFVTALYSSAPIATVQTQGMWPSWVSGTVISRNLVRGPNGQPIFAEFNEQGDVVNEIGEATNDLANATVISGDAYRASYAAYTAYMAQYGDTDARGAYVLDRDSYHASILFTVDGQRVTNVPRLLSGTQSVLVRNPVALLTPGTNPILFESAVDLNQIQDLDPSINSILLTASGQSHTTSRFNIGYRASFVKPKGEGEVGECAPSYDASQDNKYFNYREDDPCGPVSGALIETQILPGVDGGTISGRDGKYFLTYMSLPCPGFDFEFTHLIIRKIFYRNFNPRSPSGINWYYSYSPVYDFCFGSFENLKYSTSLSGQMAYVNALGIAATLPVPNKVLNPKIDIIVLTGKGKVGNSLHPNDVIPVGTTQYGTDLPTFAPVAPEALDLDGDGATDPTAISDYDGDGKVEVGVYLNGRLPSDTDAQGNPIPPDLIRQTDTVPDFNDQGLLQTISDEDLKDTDIYIYRLSNGQQILARKGLVPTEYARGQGSGLLDDGSSGFYYRAMVPGRSISSSYTRSSYEAFQTRAGINPAFHQRRADHLRVGEFVKVITVNRKTGYIGTVTTQVGNAATNSDGTQGIGESFVDFPIYDIVMRPPNLKIKAERKYNVEAGLTRGEERNYLIGFEGSALNSDRVVAISTEWMDHDGTPLPDDLPGYTGRVAKVVSNTGADRLQAAGTDRLAEFEIKPGTHLQLIQLPENGALGNQHFYIHINGKPPEDSPDFSSDANGAGPGILQYRPNYYVPFRVPIFDEVETRRRRNEQLYAEQSGTLTEADVAAAYRWPYRSEMQFSVFDLNMEKINRTDADGTIVDIYPAGADDNQETIPGFTSSDTSADLVYDLLQPGTTGNPLDPLDPFGAQRELIFSFGAEETSATLGADQTVQFDNFNQLSELTVDDFLTISLYQNTDAENVLWEFAFEYLGLDTRLAGYDNQTDDTFYITADDPTVPFHAVLFGYANRAPEQKPPVTIRWTVEGAGSMSPPIQTDDDLGVFPSDLTMPHSAGATAIVRATMMSTGSPVTAKFKRVEVLPGQPAQVSITATGQAVAMESGTLTATVTVRDQFGNLVADGTDVSVGVTENSLITAYDASTTNGQAVVKITGDAYATPGAVLTVKSGTAEGTHNYDIQPLSLNFQVASTTVQRNGSQPVQVAVTTPTGEPVPNTLVSLSSDLGQFNESQIITDATGIASVTFSAGHFTGNGNWFARTGFAGTATQAFFVNDPASLVQADTRDVMVIGDAAVDGAVTYTRYDGTDINLAYQVSGNITANGSANSSHAVTLGDMADPNIEPLLAFYMNEVETTATLAEEAPDEVGLHPGLITNIDTVTGTINGPGKSYRFNGNSQIQVAADTSLNPFNNVGFRLEVKPSDGNGTLISHVGDTQKISLVNGQVVYAITTTTGTYSVTSAAIALDQWHTIAGRYRGGQLELSVDGTVSTATGGGDLDYASSTQSLVLGNNYQGQMNSFRWYDWNAPQLLQLPNGTEADTLVLDATGAATVAVSSMGNLGSLKTGSSLKTLRVAVNIGDQRHFVSVMSREAFKEIGREYTDNYSTTAPAINLVGLRLNPYESYANRGLNPLDYLIKPAHAAWYDIDAWEAIKTTVSFLIPYEDFAMLGKQLYYLANQDWQNFNAADLTFSALGVATIIPIMKPLKPVLGPVKTFVRRFGNKPIIKHLSGVLGQATEKALKGNTDKLFSLLPYFLIVADLVRDPDGLEALNMIIDTVESPDDIWTWVDYLNLPADGWIGTTVPPLNLAAAPVNATGINSDTLLASLNPVDWVIPQAHAAPGGGLRVSAAVMRRMIKALKSMDAEVFAGSGRQLLNGIKAITKEMKVTNVTGLRKLVFSPKVIVAATALGGNALRNVMRNLRNLRMSPLAILATITYIESRRGDCADIAICKPFLPTVSAKIPQLYKQAFMQVLIHNGPFLGGSRENGALFHMALLAVKHLEYETAVTNQESHKIIDIERTYQTQLYTQQGTRIKPFGSKYGRRVDIVLAGQGGLSTANVNNVFVEAKSLSVITNTPSTAWKRSWAIWNVGKANQYPNHRQFYLDRLMTKNNPLVLGEDTRQATSFEWWLQEFNRPTRSGYRPSELQYVHKQLQKLPKPLPKKGGVGYNSLGYTAESLHNRDFTERDVSRLVKPFNLKTWLTNTARSYVLDGIGDDLITNYVTNSDKF